MFTLPNKLPLCLINTIVSLLDARSKKLLHSTSKKLGTEMAGPWNRRVSLAQQAQALGLFHAADSVLTGTKLTRQVASIAFHPLRSISFRNWIKDQKVCMDDGGFYIQNNDNESAFERTRIELWDTPVGLRKIYSSGDYSGGRVVCFLKQAFVQKGYDP